MYVYIRSEPQLYTVGFYKPNGEWEPDSDHATVEAARSQVILLNGGTNCGHVEKTLTRFADIEAHLEELQESISRLEKLHP